MVQLFLCEPNWSSNGDDDSVTTRISLLNNLDSIIRVLIASQSRSEARLWLCKDLSRISSLSRQHKLEIFLTILQTSSQKREVAAQLMQMIFEKHPKKAGSIIAKKSDMLEDFFRGNQRRILLWFSNFSGTGDMEHRKGAKALSQFAFKNRDICWEELEWKGKHGQSPAMVATKPHYFLDLDVEITVENFLENVPEFWSSHEFSDTLKDGEILFMDTKFFVNMFVSLMYKEDDKEIWEVVNEFLKEESFSSLCSHLLTVLNEGQLCNFLDSIRKHLDPKTDFANLGDRCHHLEVMLSRFDGSDSFDELILLNMLINRGRQLLQLLQEREHREVRTQIEDIVKRVCTVSENSDDLVPLIKEFSNKKSMKSMKLLGLQSWALFCFLSEGNWGPKDWESLFNDNGVSFRQWGKHELVGLNGSDDEIGSDSDRGSGSRKSRKKGKHRKKRKRRRNMNLDDDFLGLDFSYNRMDFESKASCWVLSTDGYSTSWSSADLPEHLSKYCFSTWLKWGFSRFGNPAS